MNPEIVQIRQNLETLDGELLRTLERRFELAKDIGIIKRTNGFPVEDKEREQQIIQSILPQTTLCPEFTKNLFELIFQESKSIQNEP
jgi:chorismate mutase